VCLRHAEFDRYEYLNPVQYVVADYRVLVDRLRAHPEVRAVSPRIRVPGAAFRGEQQFATIGVGLDLEMEQEYQDLERIVAAGRLPRPDANEALLGRGLAADLGVEIGDIVTFLIQTRRRGTNAFTVDVVGLADFPVPHLNTGGYILPIGNADRYMRMDGASSEILLKSAGGETGDFVDTMRTFLAESQRTELSVVPWTQISAGYSYLRTASIVYNIIALVFFLLASTVIISTTMMIIHERTREIGTLAAMGMHGRELVRLFFLESAFLGAAGSFVGVVIGTGITIPLSRIGIDFGSAMEMAEMDLSSVLYPVLNVRSTVLVFVFGLAVAMLSTYPSARRAAKLPPVEALRAE
jgi:putative ABC transport system permease protein